MATWPSTLPQSLLSGLTRKRQSGVIRSDMETGPAKQRSRFTAVTKQYNGELILTGTELGYFDTFYETTLGQGADSFTWIDPFDDTSKTIRFYQEPDVKMIRPSDTVANRLYSVTLALEILP